MRRVRRGRETLSQRLERSLPFRAWGLRVQRRRYRHDVLDVAAQRFLLCLDGIETAVDAAGQSPELFLCEPPFFSSKLRWIETRTSLRASAIRRPEGCSGPP
jgi:hypothetical protein